MTNEINLLLVEDEIVYSRIILYQLSIIEVADHKISVHTVASVAEMKEMKEFLNPDIILLDLGLPDSSGSDTFIVAKEIFPKSAIIILSGTDNNQLASKIVSNGAQDYLTKADLDIKILRKTIDHALDRMHYQNTLEVSDFKYHELFQNSPTPLFLFDRNQKKINFANQALSTLMGSSNEKRVIHTLETQLSELIEKKNQEHDYFSTNISINSSEEREIFVQLICSKLKDKQDSYICQLIANSPKEIKNEGQSVHNAKSKIEKLISKLNESKEKDSLNYTDIIAELRSINEILEKI